MAKKVILNKREEKKKGEKRKQGQSDLCRCGGVRSEEKLKTYSWHIESER